MDEISVSMSRFSTITKDIIKLVKGDCSFDEETLDKYSTAACWYKITPVAVVFPKDNEDVQALVKYAYENDIAVIPRGAGTGLAGQAIGYGIIIDFTKYMNCLVSVKGDTAVVQPGMVYSELIEELKPHQKYFPVDPTSGNLCTIGGMIGTNAAGYHGIKYGSMRDHVESIDVILSNGEIASFGAYTSREGSHEDSLFNKIYTTIPSLLNGSKQTILNGFPDVPKNSSGYDLIGAVGPKDVDFVKLLVGSEGTLAIAVAATLRLLEPMRNRVGALAYFRDYNSTIGAVLAGIEFDPSAIELLDHSYVQLASGSDPLVDALIEPSSKAMLYFEFEGNDLIRLQKQMVQLNRALAHYDPIKFFPLTTPIEQKSLWQLREIASRVINLEKSSGKTSFIEDVTVPLKNLSQYIETLGQILSRNGIEYSIYGHAGVGNIHCAPFVDLGNPNHYRSIDPIASEVTELAISLGGTLSGEHGDGFVRTPFLERLYGTEIYDLFKMVKSTFDPKNILNPGKIIGEQNSSILHDLQVN